MELKRNTRPFGQPSTQPETRRAPIFITEIAAQPPQEVQTLEEVVPVLQPVSRAYTTSIEAPNAIPRLEPVTRQRQVVNLTPPGTIPELSPQPTAEVEAVAEPVKRTGGGRVAEWPFGGEPEVGPAPTPRPLEVRGHGIPSLEPVSGRRDNSNVGPAVWAESGPSTPGYDDQNIGSESVTVVEEVPAIPSLSIIRDGGTSPLTDIPQLDVFNNMETAYLLLGKSSETDEIVILQSYGERVLRGKSNEDKVALLSARIGIHRSNMIAARYYDHESRSDFKSFQILSVSPQHKSRGVEFAFALKDLGVVDRTEATNYAEVRGIALDEAYEHLKLEESTSYTWALIKFKIGRDFGSFSLTDLMPDL